MKSKLELALLGIILQSVDFILDFDVFQLNITSAIAFVLIIIGLLPYKTEQNRLFSKCLKSSIRIAVIFAVSVVMTVFNFATYNSSVSMLFYGMYSFAGEDGCKAGYIKDYEEYMDIAWSGHCRLLLCSINESWHYCFDSTCGIYFGCSILCNDSKKFMESNNRSLGWRRRRGYN